jgi:hypothetical protein
MPTFTPPANLHGQQLAEELAAAGIALASELLVDGDGQLVVDTEASPSSVQAVLDAHVPAPPPDPEAEFRQAVEAATSLAALKDALLGKTGPGAEPRQPAR